MKIRLTIIAFVIPFLLHAQQPANMVPKPVKAIPGNGSFSIDATSSIHTSEETAGEAALFASYLEKYYSISITVSIIRPGTRNNPITEKSILLVHEKERIPSSSYSLKINPSGCTIVGDKSGIFYGLQTLQQLLPVEKNIQPTLNIAAIDIDDYPRFPYRGMHLDVGRHMFSVDYIKKYIDYLAYHKFNYFHWHLTEDQGWRIEIKKFPKLTETGSCREQTLKGRYGSDKYDGTPYCGYFTQEEARAIVQYARERHITVIPEIDMPGHSLSALTSYPYLGCTKGPYKVMETWGVAHDVLCAGNDSTFAFMESVLEEIMQIFPSKYIHIGGDECPKERWKKCPDCQKKITEQQLTDEHGLQSYFIRRIEKFVNSKGRTIIGWDEILEGGLAPNAVVMSWRGEAGGIASAKQNHFVIMTPENPLYLNHSQTKNEDSVTQGGYNPIEHVYRYDPIPKELNEQQSGFILGAQGNMWSEYLNNEKKLEYMLFPRISALSEVLWTQPSIKDWKDFDARLPGILKRYDLWGVNYSTAHYDLQPSVIPLENSGIGWKLETRKPGASVIYVRDSLSNVTATYKRPIRINSTGLYGAAVASSDQHIVSPWIWQRFHINKATGKKIRLAAEPNKSYSLGGAFALVDGVQNELGMLRSAQFLGFNGRNCEAIIDLGKQTKINEIILHAFEQPGSWIYRPASVSFFISRDGKAFQQIQELPSVQGTKNIIYRLQLEKTTRFIKIIGKNRGMIPDGLPGAGHSGWIFIDEIEVH